MSNILSFFFKIEIHQFQILTTFQYDSELTFFR